MLHKKLKDSIEILSAFINKQIISRLVMKRNDFISFCLNCYWKQQFHQYYHLLSHFHISLASYTSLLTCPVASTLSPTFCCFEMFSYNTYIKIKTPTMTYKPFLIWSGLLQLHFLSISLPLLLQSHKTGFGVSLTWQTLFILGPFALEVSSAKNGLPNLSMTDLLNLHSVL